MDSKQKKDNYLMGVLEVSEIRHHIANTNKGELNLCLRKGTNEYFLTLDSIPLEPEINKEVMSILFPVASQQIPHVKQFSKENIEKLKQATINTPLEVKPRGRPKSK